MTYGSGRLQLVEGRGHIEACRVSPMSEFEVAERELNGDKEEMETKRG